MEIHHSLHMGVDPQGIKQPRINMLSPNAMFSYTDYFLISDDKWEQSHSLNMGKYGHNVWGLATPRT